MSRLVSDEALATLTIWQEAQGEPFEGMTAVAEVIRNRMARKYSSDGTVAGTIARRYQFSGWNDDPVDNALLIKSLKLDDTDGIVQQCLRAWLTAQAGSEFANGAVLYFDPTNISPPSWLTKNVIQVTKIGRHTFFDEVT